jgi:ADP-heptose:LPS heptosyltransferase
MRNQLRSAILLLIRLLGEPQAWMMRRAHRLRPAQPVQAPRILLVRPDHLGDLVLTTPVLNALKKQVPDAALTMMVGPWSSEVVARHPAIDELLTCRFPGFQRAAQHPLAPYVLLFQTARQLRQGKYDLAINLRPDFWWGAALLYLAGIPRRVGYHTQPGAPFLTHTLPFIAPEHATISNLRLCNAALQALGYAELAEPFTPANYPLVFTPTPDERAWAAQRLTAEGVEPHTPIVVIHPGTGGAVKLWRTEAWSYLANALVQAPEFVHPPTIILTGSPAEHPLLSAIAQGLTSAPLICSEQSVGQLAALLERARLVLGVDNGPLHLATAQQRPTLRLFGPTDARIFGPWGDTKRHIVIASTQRCPDCPFIPCGRLDFPSEALPAHLCVKHIREQEVEAAIMSLLAQTGDAIKQS